MTGKTMPKPDRYPDDTMTRAEFVVELMDTWTEALETIRHNPNGSFNEDCKREDIEVAIDVLKRTYSLDELMFEADLYKNQINEERDADK